MLKVHQNPTAKQLSSDKPRHPTATVSIAFYNNLDFLKLTLAGLSRQTDQTFEIIIGDDGSNSSIVEELHALLANYPIPVTHLWHEDRGFRKNRMLNWVIHQARSPYLIFLDQDCIPHREFVREHLKARAENCALSGRRMELTPWQSRLLTPEKVKNGFLETQFWWLALTGLYMRDAHSSKGMHLPDGRLRKFLQNRKSKGLVGCNFSAWKQDLLKVNGFDFRYEAPGIGEDSDIDFRLRQAEVKILSVEYAAIQYHIFHPMTQKPEANESLFREVQRRGSSTTDFGIEQQISQ